MSEKMREEFEAWMHTFDLPPALEGEVFDDENYMDADCFGQFVYDDHSTQRCWAAWQASRESLEIDLPAVMEMEYYGGVMDSEDVLDAIQSVGLKLKP